MDVVDGVLRGVSRRWKDEGNMIDFSDSSKIEDVTNVLVGDGKPT